MCVFYAELCGCDNGLTMRLSTQQQKEPAFVGTRWFSKGTKMVRPSEFVFEKSTTHVCLLTKTKHLRHDGSLFLPRIRPFLAQWCVSRRKPPTLFLANLPPPPPRAAVDTGTRGQKLFDSRGFSLSDQLLETAFTLRPRSAFEPPSCLVTPFVPGMKEQRSQMFPLLCVPGTRHLKGCRKRKSCCSRIPTPSRKWSVFRPCLSFSRSVQEVGWT